MYSDAVSEIVISSNGHAAPARAANQPEPFEKWEDWEPARLIHHGRPCCETAREWLTAMDFAALAGDSVLTGPRWLCARFKWGPSAYPVAWCEAARRKSLDCGVLAAFACEVFAARGVPVHRTQIVQLFSTISGRQWENAWSSDGAATDWIDGERIYHEGCAIRVGESEIKIWDASAGFWLEPKGVAGYGSVLAVKIAGVGDDAEPFMWSGRRLQPNRWENLAAVNF